MSRYTGGTHAWQGVAAADIQDNSGTASSFYHTSTRNVSSYTSMEVEFYFKAVSMETNEDLWVQYFDGAVWRTVASYAAGVHFNNNTFYVATVPISRSSYSFPTNARLRFMCDASNDNDDVYIDSITWRGTTSGIVQEPRLAVLEGGGDELGGARTLDETGVVSLTQNRPNPFDGNTTISFSLAGESHVALEVFDVAGRKVATLLDETRGAGTHSVEFDGRTLTPGIYFYRLVAGDVVAQRKMLLLQ
jgi:hypothetical protein